MVSLISFAQRTGYRLISLRDEEIASLVVTRSVSDAGGIKAGSRWSSEQSERTPPDKALSNYFCSPKGNQPA